MRFILLILIMLSVVWAEDLTLIGLSGARYKIPYDSDLGVDVVALCKALYFANIAAGDSVRIRNAGHVMTLKLADSSPKLDGKTQNYLVVLKKHESKFWVSTSNIVTFLNAISTYSFSYNQTMKELTVLKASSSSVKSPTSPTVSSPSTPANVTIKKPTAPKSAVSPAHTGIIVIDPGHGGKDPGAIGATGTYEKDIVLAIARKTAKYIRENSTFSVFLTREGDTFIPLRDRTTYANNRNADLFVSIHANAAAKNDTVSGYKIYFLSDAKNATDERIAVFENAVINLEESVGESDIVQSVLKDMINNEYLKESQELSASIEGQFHSSLPSVKPLFTGVGQANFYVLNGAQMPSVLVETGFLTNKVEEKLLKDDVFQTKMAQALGKSILAFHKKQGR